ncbi:MAG: nickel pincer cofactor biosynthesis protein LarB [Candidatus Altiarchaeota archaeon]
MKIVTPDYDRPERCGIPEVVYGEYKTVEDLIEIAHDFIGKMGRFIATKVSGAAASEFIKRVGLEGSEVVYHDKARVIVARKKGFTVSETGSIGIITAGTSDVPIAEEARVIAVELGCIVTSSYDIGIAGVHRLFPALKEMSGVKAIIVVAGMEGALPALVSGLVDVPVIGVPTSVGYGVGKGGRAALNTMLNSCTPVAVVNIDNGYGAAVLAYQIARL